ncbi:MAG: flagellar type III secretion system pore protein FliP [Cyanobacteriota bacterium]
MKTRFIFLIIFLLGILFLLFVPEASAQVSLPTFNVSVGSSDKADDLTKGLQILIILTVLTLAPSILVLMTSFTRIIIVLSLVRQAIGTPSLPPNQVIVGLSLILTFFIMAPTFDKINTNAIQPYVKGEIIQDEAIKKGLEPLRTFMFKQTNEKDLALFVKMAKIERPKVLADVPTYVLIPSFIISELKKAFQIGFIIFLPFLIIDVVVASILISMGMLFLPPVTVSLPFKIVLFVIIDGWHLITKALVTGFMV